MNGRVYDPLIGRFMSADPFIQAPGNLQSYNRYAYVMNNPLAYTDPSGYWSLRIKIDGFTLVSVSSQTIVRGLALAADFAGCGGYCSAAVGAYYGAKNGGGFEGAVVGGVTSYVAFQFAGNFSTDAYVVAGVSGCANASVHGGDCAKGATAGLINKGAAQAGQATGYEMTAAALGGCASSRVSGGSCSDGAAAALGSMAVNYVIMDFTQNMRAEYDRYQYRTNSTAMGPAIAMGFAVVSDAGAAVTVGGFWTWLVGGGASAAVGAWAGRNWDRISAVLNVNGADKPPGIPDGWREEPTKGDGGRQWVNPDNPGDRVRVMPGNPDSPNPSQREPYVRDVRNGNQWLDVNGNRIEGKNGRNSPDTHIPARDYVFRP